MRGISEYAEKVCIRLDFHHSSRKWCLISLSIEYITTLEGDIAERDRLLDHFRTRLGSQESENLALRQEIATLKKALLDGRGGPINLPPPAPLPEQSAAETLASSNTNVNTTAAQSSPLLTANTQKDLPTSPRIGGPRFWGGVGMGGGVTPVHTTLVPDISTIVRNGLQENMNPSLNVLRSPSIGNGIGPSKALGGFDGYADLNPFTMKTLDACVSLFASSIMCLTLSKQLSHAPLGQNGCPTANTPAKSSIAESSDSFKLGVQYASSLLLHFTQAQLAVFIRIQQHALCSAFWKAPCSVFISLGIPYTADLSLASSERRRFTTCTSTPIFIACFCQFIFVDIAAISERTACYVGRHG